MHYVRRNLRQWLQDKTALVHRGMRNGQFRRIQNFVTEKNNIDVYGAWALGFSAHPAHGLLHRKHAA